MRVKFTVAAASLMVGLPATSFALGLGDIQLRSSLNAPLDAQIELIGATPEELGGLRAQIASRETFARYGLDYPSFLAGIQVRFVRDESRPYIELRSTSPITEPFATLLVEVNYPRGRQVREYTVLLDPPVFAPQGAVAQAPAPVAAPVVGDGQRSGDIARPAPAPQPAAQAPVANPAPQRQPQPAAPSSAAGDTYEVRRGDTLSKIAASVVGSGQSQQHRAMIAIYRGNPQAFDGNINLLRSGAILRLPDGAAIDSVDAAEAGAEVRRQSANWQANRPGGAPAETGGQQDRLRLVPPADAPPATPGTGTAGTGPGAATGGGADLQRRVEDLERQLAESRRLLDLRNAELARLQGAPPPAVAPAPAAPSAESPPAADTPVPPAPPAAPEATTPPPPADAAPAAPAPAEEGGLLALLKTFWYVPAGLLALLLALFGLSAARRRRESDLDASLGLGGSLEPGFRDTSADTLPLRKPNITAPEDRSFVVEESGAHERPALGAVPVRATSRVEVDEPALDIPLVEQTASLDQGDPLAEADFHMAYGLYDQAADLVRLAIQRDPGRRDLRLKLLEVFFVWGNREQFLQTARELAASRAEAQPGEWEKVVIMGKQLAPEDPLFAQGAASGAAAGGVDLNLEGGQNRVDFDLLGEPGVELGVDGGIDLDLGAALRDRDPTGDALQIDPGTLDFPLDDPQRGADTLAHTATTRQMAQPLRGGDDSPTINRVGAGHDGPTVEQPGLPGGETIRQKLDIASQKFGTDQTAELALDDLGLDLGSLDDTGQANNLDDSRITRGLDSPEAPTLVAGLDDESRDLINAARGDQADAPTLLAPAPDASVSESGTWLFDDKSFLDPSADTNRADGNVTQAIPFLPDAEDASPTSKLRAIEGNLDVDFDMDSLAATGRNESLPAADAPLDLDVGMPETSETGTFQQTQRLQHDELALPMELEPATMSEVGTKLDLARAYMDMGDPEGARSILFEVLDEGSNTQKTEAQRLLDSIPG